MYNILKLHFCTIVVIVVAEAAQFPPFLCFYSILVPTLVHLYFVSSNLSPS